MPYEEIVEVIREVTKLDTPVYFNNMEANCHGSPYFGVGKHILEICPEEIFNDPMFEPIDFIENKHIGFYHIGLPAKILKRSNGYLCKAVREQLQKAGIDMFLDEQLLETFIILHEFGHAHELFVSYKGNAERYISETAHENGYNSYIIKSNGLGGTEEGLKIHKSSLTEQYADNFAINHFKQVVEMLSDNHVVF